LLLDDERSVGRLPSPAFFCSLVDLASSFLDSQDHGYPIPLCARPIAAFGQPGRLCQRLYFYQTPGCGGFFWIVVAAKDGITTVIEIKLEILLIPHPARGRQESGAD